jgi:hypothetical protein
MYEEEWRNLPFRYDVGCCAMTNTPMFLPLPKRGAAVKPLRALALVAICGVVITACSRDDGDTSPVASLSVSVSPSEGEVGSPLDMTYTWVVAPDAPSLAGDVWVFVHFLDADGERMWTDDHQPPTPANEWKPGSTIRYTRTTFVPRYQYLGQANVAVGLYSRDSGERFPLSGAEDMGLRSYRVARFDMRVKTDKPFVVFSDGWYEPEGTPVPGGAAWRWSKKMGTLSFRNPKRDVLLFLDADEPLQLPEPRSAEVHLGSVVIDSFPLTANHRELRRVNIAASQLGHNDTVEVTIAVDRTFVPKALPLLASPDPRELGIRVFHAYVRPQ